MIAFDLSADPSGIRPPYWFYCIFFSVGVGLATWAAIGLRRGWRSRKRLAVFAAIWLCVTSYVSVTDAEDVMAVRKVVADGKLTTAEGCLAYFHPGLPYGSRGTAGDERWAIGDYDFSYGAGEVRPGYHLTEPNGGAVHGDSRVRVSFVTSPHEGRAEIIRLSVAAHACPPAPDRLPA